MASSSLIAAQEKFAEKFRRSGATIPVRARKLSEIGIKDSPVFRKLVSKGIILEANKGRYYMDINKSKKAVKKTKTRDFLLFFIIGLLIIIAFLIFV